MNMHRSWQKCRYDPISWAFLSITFRCSTFALRRRTFYFVSNFSFCLKIVNPCFVTRNNVCKLCSIEFGKQFEHFLQVTGFGQLSMIVHVYSSDRHLLYLQNTLQLKCLHDSDRPSALVISRAVYHSLVCYSHSSAKFCCICNGLCAIHNVPSSTNCLIRYLIASPIKMPHFSKSLRHVQTFIHV